MPSYLEASGDSLAGRRWLELGPVTVFDDQAGIGRQGIIVRLAYDELESALLDEWHQWSQAGGADLFARPAWSLPAVMITVGCHSLFSSGVGCAKPNTPL